MSRDMTAKLPDGSESRGGWILWLFAGFFLGGFLASWTTFFDALVLLLQSASPVPQWLVEGARGDVLSYLMTLGFLTAILVPLGRFATTRLLMPSVVWLALAVVPALFVALLLPDQPSVAPWATAPLVALAIGWLAARNTGRQSGRLA